ncbi:MAG TPA: hypothetical protein VMD04_02785 [Candidatus Margulisiibacteriota bacterium]|nr:hypothetical protein [Candidatus Margulisiibacteriota bacterium]
MGFIPVSDVLMLIALAGGYIVFYLAKREETIPRLVGYCISAIIITSSILYMLTSSWMQSRVFDAKMRFYQQHMMMKSGCGPGGAMPKMSPKMPMPK